MTCGRIRFPAACSESSCPNENEVDDAAAPVSFTTPDELKSLSPIIKLTDSDLDLELRSSR